MDGLSAIADEIERRDWNIGRLFCAALDEARERRESFEQAWQGLMLQLRPPRDPHPELARQLAEDRELLRSIKPYLAAAYEGTPLDDGERDELRRAAEEKVADLRIEPEQAKAFEKIAGTVPLAG